MGDKKPYLYTRSKPSPAARAPLPTPSPVTLFNNPHPGDARCAATLSTDHPANSPGRSSLMTIKRLRIHRLINGGSPICSRGPHPVKSARLANGGAAGRESRRGDTRPGRLQ